MSPALRCSDLAVASIPRSDTFARRDAPCSLQALSKSDACGPSAQRADLTADVPDSLASALPLQAHPPPEAARLAAQRLGSVRGYSPDLLTYGAEGARATSGTDSMLPGALSPSAAQSSEATGVLSDRSDAGMATDFTPQRARSSGPGAARDPASAAGEQLPLVAFGSPVHINKHNPQHPAAGLHPTAYECGPREDAAAATRGGHDAKPRWRGTADLDRPLAGRVGDKENSKLPSPVLQARHPKPDPCHANCGLTWPRAGMTARADVRAYTTACLPSPSGMQQNRYSTVRPGKPVVAWG